MTITTSKGKTYTVDWIDAATIAGDQLAMQMQDSRKLSKIAAEFEGLTKIERKDEQQGDKTFEGYRVLTQINRNSSGSVQLFMSRE